MIDAKPSIGNQQMDVRALGYLMVRLMELGTSLMDPQSLELKHPDRWDGATRTFLAKTEHSSADDLLKVANLQGLASAVADTARMTFSRKVRERIASRPWC